MKKGMYREPGRTSWRSVFTGKNVFGGVLVHAGVFCETPADYAAVFRQLKKAGVEKAYVYPVGYFNFNDSDDIYPGYRADLKWINLGPDVLQELRRLDYLLRPWVWSMNRSGQSVY